MPSIQLLWLAEGKSCSFFAAADHAGVNIADGYAMFSEFLADDSCLLAPLPVQWSLSVAVPQGFIWRINLVRISAISDAVSEKNCEAAAL